MGGGWGVNDKYQIKMNDYVQRTSTRKSCGHQPLSPKRLTTEEQERLRNTETEKKKKRTLVSLTYKMEIVNHTENAHSTEPCQAEKKNTRFALFLQRSHQIPHIVEPAENLHLHVCDRLVCVCVCPSHRDDG